MCGNEPYEPVVAEMRKGHEMLTLVRQRHVATESLVMDIIFTTMLQRPRYNQSRYTAVRGSTYLYAMSRCVKLTETDFSILEQPLNSISARVHIVNSFLFYS